MRQSLLINRLSEIFSLLNHIDTENFKINLNNIYIEKGYTIILDHDEDLLDLKKLVEKIEYKHKINNVLFEKKFENSIYKLIEIRDSYKLHKNKKILYIKKNLFYN